MGQLEAPRVLWHSLAVIQALAFVFGLVFGSFLNVCIRRLPRHESLVRPGSHCPQCRTPIRPRDNIPVLSYLLLGGRCRACDERISPEYPLVELLTGALFLGCYWQFGATLDGAKWALFCSMMVVLMFTDLHDRLLPDRVNYFGLVAGLVLSPFTSTPDHLPPWVLSGAVAIRAPLPAGRLVDSVLAAVLFGGLLLLLSEIWLRIFHRQGMGLGDVKMMAMAGAFLGVRLAFAMLLVASVLASVLGLVVLCVLFLAGWKRGVAERAHRMGLGRVWNLRWMLVRRYELPFGTYLGITGILMVFVAGPMLHLYISAVGMGR